MATTGATDTRLSTWKIVEDVQKVRAQLAARNVDVNARDYSGQTPLHKAAFDGSHEIVALWLNARADCNVTDDHGDTPLLSAAYRGNEKVVELLLRAGANCNVATKSGRTPLHMACSSRKSVLARALLVAGADHNARDNVGLKPLHLCLLRGVSFADQEQETLRTLQVLVTFGATWDDKCDELIATRKAGKEAPALRVCVLLWARQHARGHPLTQIELEVLRRGPEAVQAFFKELKKSTEIHHRRKICVVGPSNAGKTSLIKSIVTEISSLQHPDDRTIGVDQFKLRFGVQVDDDDDIVHEVTFWDFAGQDEYQVAHSLFYSRRTLYLVCVDLEAYLLAYIQADITNDTKVQRERMMNEFIERSVLKWVRAIFARQPDAEFVFVATKEDLLIYRTFTTELQGFLAVKLAEIEGIVRELQREVADQLFAVSSERKADTLTLHAYNKRVKEREAIDQETSGNISQLARVEVETVLQSEVMTARPDTRSKRVRLKLAWSRTCDRIASAVSGRASGVEETLLESPLDRMTELAAASGTFAWAVQTKSRPTIFISCTDRNAVAKARLKIERLIHSSERSFRMPESYSSVLNAVVTMREAVAKRDACTRIGVVFASIDPALESLSSRLKIDRTTVRSILQILHDLGDVLWYEDLGVPLFERTVIFDPMLLIDFVRQVITHAHKVDVLSHTELIRLPFWIDLHDDDRILAMKQMLQKFQLVHPTHGEMKWDSDLIVPAFWKAKTPASWLFKYADLRLVHNLPAQDPRGPKERVRVHWEYMFTHEFPDALFDHLVVASYQPGKRRTAGPDWILYAEDRFYACRVMVTRDVGTKQRVLQLEAVQAEAADDMQAAKLWEAFEILGEAIVEVLRRYPGIVFTSTALDTDGKASRLEDLFSFRRTIEMEQWMPRKSTWEMYQVCVTDASTASGA